MFYGKGYIFVSLEIKEIGEGSVTLGKARQSRDHKNQGIRGKSSSSVFQKQIFSYIHFRYSFVISRLP